MSAAQEDASPSQEEHNRAVHRDVARRLGELYAVAAGLSLAAALERAVGANVSSTWWANPDWALTGAFLLTLIPFYHGTMRHIDEEWATGRPVAPGLMLIDFVWLFLQAGCLFILGRQIPNAERFTQWYCALLVIDILWALTFIFGSYLAERGPDGRQRARQELKRRLLTKNGDAAGWMWLNLLTLLVVIVVVMPLTDGTALGIFIIALVRSTLDYAMGWKFYFPHATRNLWGSAQASR